jgi:hypothetical protein
VIQYSLICENEHKFDAWFKSASTFDEQVVRGIVSCPVCAASKVSKALMAPAVSRKDSQKKAQTQKIALSAGHPDQEKLRSAMRALREKVTSQADYVGDKFAEEARKIHDHEADARGIYGEATVEEAASLLEDGVDFMPLPTLPEEQN